MVYLFDAITGFMGVNGNAFRRFDTTLRHMLTTICSRDHLFRTDCKSMVLHRAVAHYHYLRRRLFGYHWIALCRFKKEESFLDYYPDGVL